MRLLGHSPLLVEQKYKVGSPLQFWVSNVRTLITGCDVITDVSWKVLHYATSYPLYCIILLTYSTLTLPPYTQTATHICIHLYMAAIYICTHCIHSYAKRTCSVVKTCLYKEVDCKEFIHYYPLLVLAQSCYDVPLPVHYPPAGCSVGLPGTGHWLNHWLWLNWFCDFACVCVFMFIFRLENSTVKIRILILRQHNTLHDYNSSYRMRSNYSRTKLSRLEVFIKKNCGYFRGCMWSLSLYLSK